MTGAARGILAVVVSLGLNIGLLWGMLLTVAPRALEDQEIPKLDVELEAAAVPQSTAQATDPVAEAASQGAVSGPVAQGSAVPKSRAGAMSAAGAPLTEAAPAVFAAAGARPAGVALSQRDALVETVDKVATMGIRVAPSSATIDPASAITADTRTAPAQPARGTAAGAPMPEAATAAQANLSPEVTSPLPTAPDAAEATALRHQAALQIAGRQAPVLTANPPPQSSAPSATPLPLALPASSAQHPTAVQAQAETLPALPRISPREPAPRAAIVGTPARATSATRRQAIPVLAQIQGSKGPAPVATATPARAPLAMTAPPEQAATSQVNPSPARPIPGRQTRPATGPSLRQPLDNLAPASDIPPAAPRLSLAAFAPLTGPAITAETPAATSPRAPATPAAQTRPQAAPLHVALSWSGTADMRLDAQSLGALEAFLAPGTPQTEQTRDRISRLLTDLPCARLQTRFSPESGTLELIGHVPDARLSAPITAALRAQIGPAIPVRDATQVLPAPPCRALAALDAMALPQSDEHNTNPAMIGVATFATVYRFAGGDPLVLTLTGPTYPSYLYVDYFDADGQVIHLQPNDRVPRRAMAPNAPALVGASQDGWPALDLTISPPFGQDMAVALAVSAPLFDENRPLREPAVVYLKALHQRLDTLSQTDGFRGEWAYFLISTHPR